MFFHVPFLEASLSEEFTCRIVYIQVLLLLLCFVFFHSAPFFPSLFLKWVYRTSTWHTQVLANNKKVRFADRMDRAADRPALSATTSHSADWTTNPAFEVRFSHGSQWLPFLIFSALIKKTISTVFHLTWPVCLTCLSWNKTCERREKQGTGERR